MFDGIIGAVITGLIALIGIIVSHYATKRSMKENKENIIKEIESQKEINEKSLRVQYITNKRVDWIQDLRVLISEYLAATLPSNKEVFIKMTDFKAIAEALANITMIRHRILLMLNVDEDTNQKIIIDIDNILFCYSKLIENLKSEQEWNRYSNIIMKYAKNTIEDTQICLKFEWNRVKKEAKGERYLEQDQLIDKENLYNSIPKAYREKIYPNLLSHK